MTTFHPGDRVRVKSKEELLSNLSPSALNGIGRSGFYSSERDLWFSPSMFVACEKEFVLEKPNRIEKHWWYFSESIGPEFSKEQFVFDEEWFDKIDESVDVGDIGGLL